VLAVVVAGGAAAAGIGSQDRVTIVGKAAIASDPAVRLGQTSVEPGSPPTPDVPTVSPTSVPSSVQVNCAVLPSRCGFPDASNTGVQAGVTLRRVPEDVRSGPGWVWDSRGWLSVNGNGAVLENVVVNNGISVEASNVTIRNVRINTGGEDFGIALRHTSNALVEFVEIGPGVGDSRLLVGIKDIYGDASGTVIRGADIFGTSTGVQMGSGSLVDSFIHDMGFQSGDHTNGFTSNGSTGQLTIRHNTIFNKLDQTDAISLFQDFGVEANRVVDNNLIAGGGYTLYGGAGNKGPTSNIKVTNNRFSRIYYPNGGSYGPVAYFTSSDAGNVWSGNVWDDTNKQLTP
jgi:hypothetical protein